jgi:hypothetical protein
MYTAKLGPVGSEYITPAREWIIICYVDKDQNQTYLLLSDKFCFGNMCVCFIHVSVSDL